MEHSTIIYRHENVIMKSNPLKSKKYKGFLLLLLLLLRRCSWVCREGGSHEFEVYLVYIVETLPLLAKGMGRCSEEIGGSGLRTLAALTEDLG